VDILFIHDPYDFRAAMDGSYRALDRLRAEGSVRAIGVGMQDPARLAQFARSGDFDCFLLAGRYTLLDQEGLDELLPTAAARGMSVIVGGAFNSGLLADPRPGVGFDYHGVRAGDAPLERALKMQAICANYDVPLAAAAIQFPLGHPAVSSVVVGVRSSAELQEDVRHFTRPIPNDLWRELRASGLIRDGAPLPGARSA
jgi:D-threo-aldose 1-dehydrogenase